MRTVTRFMVPIIALAAVAAGAQAQGIPTTQPSHLTIFIEDLKPGFEADHARNEAGWPAAFEKASHPYYYLALESQTGTPQAWYVSSYASYAEEGESMKMISDNSALEGELTRLWRADAQYLNGTRQIQALARPDLSYGEFPEIGLMRFWEISTWRVRLGHEQGFEAAVRVYIDNARRLTPDVSFRTYSVTAGMSGANYLIFGSVAEYGEFDQVMADGNAVFTGMSEDDRNQLLEAIAGDVQNRITNRFRLSPTMSYVEADTKAADPDFWNPNR